MQRALSCFVWFALAAPVVFGAKNLTVVLDFKGPHSASAVREMQRETETILKDSGLQLDWRLRDDAARASYDDLVVLQFRGSCVIEPAQVLYDELGPLAFTHTTDGVVLPFSQVSCDRVAASTRSAMWAGDLARADLFLGRALGRVVAHELVHILTGSQKHSHEGVGKRGLSARQLTADTLRLSAADLTRLRSL